MMEIVLLRHAQPDWEPAGRAVNDPDLTELGRLQAERAADRLAGERFTRIYTSPLRRSRQTAGPVARRHGMEPVVESWLEEVRLPDLEGEPAEKVHRFLREIRRRDLAAWWEGAPGGESFRHFHERVVGGLEPLLTNGHRACLHAQGGYHLWQVPEGEERLLFVAHCGTIAVMLSHLLGIEPVPWEWERFHLQWAGIARVRTVPIAGGAIWSLTRFNDREHLAGLPDPPG